MSRRFSGTNITIMVVAISLAVIGAPVAVAASTGSFINITDPVTAAYKARVTPKGSLAVTPRDAITGYNGKIDALGRQQVGGTVNTVASGGTQAVSGSVIAVPGAPRTPWAMTSGTANTITAPSTRLNIETISVSSVVTSGHQINVSVSVTTGGVNISVVVPVTFSYNAGTGDRYVGTLNVSLHADPGSAMTVNNFDPNGTAYVETFTVSGYLA